MATSKRKPRTAPKASPPNKSKPVFDSPFKNLKKLVAAQTKPAHPVKPASSKVPEEKARPAPDDSLLLQEALLGVRPLGGARRTPPAARLEGFSRPIVSEEAEVLAQLSDLVAGQGEFDITETEEYVEGSRAGIDPRLIVRLRKGHFAIEAHLDLHGMIQTAAKETLHAFILESVRKGQRTVLVVHGRGLGSPGGKPILKHAVSQWLSHGMLSGYVLGFATARIPDGGAGALYVLLQRNRRRAPFDVLNGAKRRD